MSKVIVRGGAPGFIRLEVEGTDTAVDVSSALTAYQVLHEVQPFMQALADAVPEPPKKNSKAPPKGDE